MLPATIFNILNPKRKNYKEKNQTGLRYEVITMKISAVLGIILFLAAASVASAATEKVSLRVYLLAGQREMRMRSGLCGQDPG